MVIEEQGVTAGGFSNHDGTGMQVSFGVHEDEESAARQYDRALLIEKGRAAKTNFPLPDYEKESKEFEDFVIDR